MGNQPNKESYFEQLRAEMARKFEAGLRHAPGAVKPKVERSLEEAAEVYIRAFLRRNSP